MTYRRVISVACGIALALLTLIFFLRWLVSGSSDEFTLRFDQKLKISVVGSSSETVEYEVVVLPNRAEVFGRLRLKLPTVLATDSTPTFYLRSTVHQLTYRGTTRNQTWTSHSMDHIFPKKVLQNHITVVDRFSRSEIIKKRQEKLYTKTHMLISSSQNGSFYNVFLYKTFTVVIDVNKVETAFEYIEKMSSSSQKQGPLSVLEEDVLYDDFVL